MNAIPRGRRFAVALASLLCAAALFHAQIASALVTRGDDLLGAGDVAGAVRCYARAIRIDGRSTVAADRLAFSLLMRHTARDAARAFDVAGTALRTAPHDPALLADRAFAARTLGRWRSAELDFAAAAAAARDARYAYLAARMAERVRDVRSARAHIRAALTIDPAYGPARRARRTSAR